MANIKTNPFAKIIFDDARTDEQKIQAMTDLLAFDVKKTPEQNQKKINDFNVLIEFLKQERQNIGQEALKASQGLGQDGSVTGFLAEFKERMDVLAKDSNNARHNLEVIEAVARQATNKTKEARDSLIPLIDSHMLATEAARKEAQTTSERLKEMATRFGSMVTDKNNLTKARNAAGAGAAKAAGTVTKTVAKGALRTAFFLTKIAASAALNQTKKPKKGPPSGPSA